MRFDGVAVVSLVAELDIGFEFKAATLSCTDLLEQGNIDSAMGTRFAVVNAASVVRMVPNAVTAVVDRSEQPAAQTYPPSSSKYFCRVLEQLGG